MTISEAELEGKRRRAAHLRSEIRSLRTEGVGSRLEADREVQARALDEEINRLETDVLDAAKSGGGSVDEAMAAMERAAKIEEMSVPKTESEDSVEETATDSGPADTFHALVARADENKVGGTP